MLGELDHSDPRSLFLQMGFLIPTLRAGLAGEQPQYMVGIQKVVLDLEASPVEGSWQRLCVGWQGKWVGRPPAPQRVKGVTADGG